MLTNRFFPMAGFDDLRREVDRLFNPVPTRGDGPSFRAGSYPPINVWEDGENLYLEAEIPGVPMKDLDIEVVGRDVTIKGKRERAAEEGANYHRHERGYGEFSRFLTLPIDVQADKVEATLKDGVLTVVLPKAEGARAKKITVKTG